MALLCIYLSVMQYLFDCCALSTGSRHWDGSWHMLCSSARVAVGRSYPAPGRAEGSLRLLLGSLPPIPHCSPAHSAALSQSCRHTVASPIPVCCLVPKDCRYCTAQTPQVPLGPCLSPFSGVPLAQGCPGRWLPIPTGLPCACHASQADYLHLETPNPFARLAQTPSPLLPTVLWAWARSKATL